MKKKVVIITLIILNICAICSAWVITSPFGIRWGRQHNGLDICADYGLPDLNAEIPSVEDGTVLIAGNECDGYGLSVVIRHNNGSEVRYGHLNAVKCTSGQKINRGDIIGLMGGSGGRGSLVMDMYDPHLHFEYFPTGNAMGYTGGGAVDPEPYLRSVNWQLTGAIGQGGSVSDLDAAPRWNWNIAADVAGGVRKAANVLITVSAKAIKITNEYLMPLLYSFVVLDFTVMFLLFFIGNTKIEENNIYKVLANKAILYCFIFFCLNNWGLLLNVVAKDGMSNMVAAPFVTDERSVEEVQAELIDPSSIMQKGFYLAAPALNYAGNIPQRGWDMLNAKYNPWSEETAEQVIIKVVLALFFGIAMMAIYVIIGMALLTYFLEFYFVGALSVCLIPFKVLETQPFKGTHLMELGTNAFQTCIIAGIKLAVVTAVSAIFLALVKDVPQVAYDNFQIMPYIETLVYSFFMMICMFEIPNRILRTVFDN